jgi:predicted nucleic acid-binding protein
MKAFFDTSVLIPIFYGDHQHHSRSLMALKQYKKSQACLAAHSLIEVYSCLSRMSGKYRIGPDQALLFVESLQERLTTIVLDAGSYRAALQSFPAKGIVGGTAYDALLAHHAIIANAEVIYTWNLQHFQQLGTEVSRRVQSP